MAGTNDRSAFEPYPAERPPRDRQPAQSEALQCTVCGQRFDLVASPEGVLLPDAAAYLRRHGRCIRRRLDEGGALATPAPARPGRRRR